MPAYSRRFMAGALALVACGAGAWDWSAAAKAGDNLLVCPPDADPANLDWSLLAPVPTVSLVHDAACTEKQVEPLATAILRDGARYVFSLVRVGHEAWDVEPVCWERAA